MYRPAALLFALLLASLAVPFAGVAGSSMIDRASDRHGTLRISADEMVRLRTVSLMP